MNLNMFYVVFFLKCERDGKSSFRGNAAFRPPAKQTCIALRRGRKGCGQDHAVLPVSTCAKFVAKIHDDTSYDY